MCPADHLDLLTKPLFAGLSQDTENLIKRHSYDEYIWASVMLYIDVLNLFINLLSLLRETQDT